MKTDVGAAYIPMPKGSGFTPHLDKKAALLVGRPGWAASKRSHLHHTTRRGKVNDSIQYLYRPADGARCRILR